MTSRAGVEHDVKNWGQRLPEKFQLPPLIQFAPPPHIRAHDLPSWDRSIRFVYELNERSDNKLFNFALAASNVSYDVPETTLLP